MAAKKLRERSKFRKPDKLSTFHYDIIGDNTFFSKGNKAIPLEDANTKQKFSQILKNKAKHLFLNVLRPFCKKTLKKIPVFKLNSKIRLIWELVILFLIVTEFLISTLEISFDIDIDEEIGTRFRHIFQFCCFFLNIIMNFNTNFYEYGVMVVNRKKICRNYLDNVFFYDLMVLFAVFPLEDIHNIKLIRVLFLFVYKTFNKIIQNFRETYSSETREDFLDLINLILKMLSIAHLLACVWYSLGFYLIDYQEKTWLTVDNRLEKSAFSKYIMSIYWAFMTMSTVGYGDITAQNTAEMGLCIFAMMLGTFGFGYYVNTVGAILNRVEERSREFVKNMKVVDNFMRRKNVNISLRMKVKKYLEFLWLYESKSLEEEKEIIEKLPISLKNEILLETNYKFLQEIHVLSKNFSQEFVEILALRISPLHFSPDDLVLSPKKFLEPSLYLIYEGEIELFFKNSNHNSMVRTLKKGEIFGEKAFFFNQNTNEHAKSKSFSTVFKINQRDFIELLREHPLDYQKYCEIRDQCVFSRNFANLLPKCNSCGKNEHFTEDCPFLSYNPDRNFVIDRLNFSRPQRRSRFLRKKPRESAFKNHKKIINDAFHVRFSKALMGFYFDKTINFSSKSSNYKEMTIFQEESDSESEENFFELRSKTLPLSFDESSVEKKGKVLKKSASLCEMKDLKGYTKIKTFDLQKQDISKMLQSNISAIESKEEIKINAPEEKKEEEKAGSSIILEKSVNSFDQSKSNLHSLFEEKNENEGGKPLKFKYLNSATKTKDSVESPRILKKIWQRKPSEIKSPLLIINEEFQERNFSNNSRGFLNNWKNTLQNIQKFNQNNKNITNMGASSLSNKTHSEKFSKKMRGSVATVTKTEKFQLKLEDENILNSLKRKKELFFSEFDVMKEFENYMKWHNVSSILKILKGPAKQKQAADLNIKSNKVKKNSIFWKKN